MRVTHRRGRIQAKNCLYNKGERPNTYRQHIPDDEDDDDDDDQLQCGQGSTVEEVKPRTSFIDILEPIVIESSDEDDGSNEKKADDSGVSTK